MTETFKPKDSSSMFDPVYYKQRHVAMIAVLAFILGILVDQAYNEFKVYPGFRYDIYNLTVQNIDCENNMTLTQSRLEYILGQFENQTDDRISKLQEQLNEVVISEQRLLGELNDCNARC